MKLLFVLPHPLLPPDRGNKQHTLNLLRQVCQHHDVDVLAFNEDSKGPKQGWEELRRELPRLKVLGVYQKLVGARLRLEQVRSLACLRPIVLARYHSRALFDVLRSSAANYDVVCFDMFLTAEGICHCGQVPTVLLATDAYSMATAGVRRLARGFRRRSRLWLEEWLLARLEARFYPRFGRVLVVSRRDIGWLERSAPRARYQFLPVPVEQAVARTRPVTDAGQRAPRVLIWAAVSQDTVAAGVKRFLEGAWPAIRERHPQARCVVWGSSPHPLLAKALRGPGVESVGFVDDWIEQLGTATIFVFPQQSGAGLYTKLQSAMALGLPCVVTLAVSGGLPAVHGETILLEEEPAGFARACIDLLSNAGMRARIGAAARRAVLEANDPVHLAEEFLKTIEQVVAERR